MRFLRSILAFIREPLLIPVVVGFAVCSMVIMGAESANSFVYPPPGEGTVMQRVEELKKDQQAMKAWIDSLPVGAMFALVMGWQAGAFLGGGVSASLAGKSQLLHAGLIGAFVLVLTIVNLFIMKQQLDYALPDWMLIAALLLPLPVSLLAGKTIEVMLPASVPPPSS